MLELVKVLIIILMVQFTLGSGVMGPKMVTAYGITQMALNMKEIGKTVKKKEKVNLLNQMVVNSLDITRMTYSMVK